MNKLRVAPALALGLLAFCFSGVVAADHGHGHVHGHVGVGIVVDPFWFGGWPYAHPPYYYPPPVVAVPDTPPVYIERDAAPQSPAYWYYCANPSGYYPDVKQCPGGWQRVAPQPPYPSDEER